MPMNIMKKHLLITTALCLLSFQAQQPELVVAIEGLRSRDGKILVALFDRADGFPDEKPTIGKTTVVSGNTPRVVFENVKPGRYALAIIHDENENGKLDTNAIGLPKEGFGFGNNVMGMFGPPSFKNASIVITDESVTHTVKMRYF